MFHRTIINQRLERVQFKIREKIPNFEFQYHSVEHVRSAVAGLEDLTEYNDKGYAIGWKRLLNPDESKFILNERYLSMCDQRYWLTRYAFIRYPDESVELIRPNIAQLIIMEIWADNEINGRSNMLLELKARQLGVSTISELAILHKSQFWPNVNSIIASCDPGKSELMAKMIELCYDEQPHWLKHASVRRLVGELIEFPETNSGISIQHGNQMNGIARGTTPSAFHLSELADFVNPEELVDASLMRAVHSNPNVFGMLESTAKGRRNWWHDTWEATKEGWPQGKTRLRPVFLPWFVGTDLYPTETYLTKDCPMPIGWKPLDVTMQHAKKAKQYVAANDLLRKYLGSGWEMSRAQMWFYENERETHRKKKMLNKFLSEMPGDDIEAFNSTNYSAFDPEVIQAYRDSINYPIDILGIRGDDIPARLQPGFYSIDHERAKTETIHVTSDWSSTKPPNEFELIPLHSDGYPSCDFSGKIFIYEWPIDEEEYVLGVDTGDGIGADRSVIQVLRKGTAWRNDEQVAEFASAYINAYDFWAVAIALGTLYSVWRRGMKRQAKIVVEVNRNGESVQLELKKRGWSNFHQWIRYDSKKIEQAKAHKLGWLTNTWSRPMSLDLLIKYLNDGLIDINSPWFVDEMGDLERDEDQQNMKAVRGGHDDRIMGMAIALLSAHILETRPGAKQIAEARSIKRAVSMGGTKPEYPRYTPGPQETDMPGQRLPVHQILGMEHEYGNAYSDYDL